MKNEKLYEIISEDLVQRQEYEKALMKFELQRFAEDRPKRNNDPWPDASNYRRKISDDKIEQKKAMYAQLIYASEYLAAFKSLSPRNGPWALKVAPYYDYVVKELTQFERNIIYALDAGLQDGCSYVKTMWDVDGEFPIFKWCENLTIIRSSTAAHFEEDERIAHVIQLTEKAAKAKYGKLPGFENLMKTALCDETSEVQSDVVGRERERYMRRGINLTGKSGRLVVWEVHYEDEGKKRIRTISPDDPKFNFEDDREYPYVDPDGKSRWMFDEFRRELLTPNAYSSRGIPEIVEEEEFLATALMRFKHNIMTLTQTPTFSSTSGLPPGSTNNFNFVLGGILPSGIAPVQWPNPPMSFDQEVFGAIEIVDKRLNTLATPSGAGNQSPGQNNKTAREIALIGSLQQMAVSYETTPWKRFIRSVLRQGWNRIVQYKPKSLKYYSEGAMMDLPPDALNGDYMIDVSWSGDNINKEYEAQKAVGLWQMSQGVPFANLMEIYKNLLEHTAPGQVQRFFVEPEMAKADMVEKIANELDIMVSTGFPVRPKEHHDHYIAVMTTMQFIEAQDAMGKPLGQQAQQLLGQYMAAHREMLAKSNPEQKKQLDQELNQLDVQRRLKRQGAAIQAAQQNIQAQAAQAMDRQALGQQALERLQGAGTNGVQL